MKQEKPRNRRDKRDGQVAPKNVAIGEDVAQRGKHHHWRVVGRGTLPYRGERSSVAANRPEGRPGPDKGVFFFFFKSATGIVEVRMNTSGAELRALILFWVSGAGDLHASPTTCPCGPGRRASPRRNVNRLRKKRGGPRHRGGLLLTAWLPETRERDEKLSTALANRGWCVQILGSCPAGALRVSHLEQCRPSRQSPYL